MSKKYEQIVPDASDGQRLDNYLIKTCKGVPKTRLYRAIRKGEVRVNKKRVDASYKLQTGDWVRVPPLRVAEGKAISVHEQAKQAIRDAVIYEDEQLLVLNKPPGMAVHGGSGVMYGVIEAVRALHPEGGYFELVHRLDRDTSGCLLIAKKASLLKQLHALLREQRAVDKRYIALLQGRLARPKTVELALRKYQLRSGERMVEPDVQGKPAKTHFEPLVAKKEATLVKVALFTGRTHQIRVHAKSIGHPVLGDSKYGEAGNVGLCLHAAEIAFELQGQRYQFRAPLPEALKKQLKKLKIDDKAGELW